MRYEAVLHDPVSGHTATNTWEADPCAIYSGCWYLADGFCPDAHEEYMWTEGDYSCDCNRLIFIEDALDVEIDDSRVCGETVRLVSLTNTTTGARLRTEAP